MGAWIETRETEHQEESTNVAPYVGAWIETFPSASEVSLRMSHPTWVRGLKLMITNNLLDYLQSHPTWVRGLKPLKEGEAIANAVAPYVGAWIETYNNAFFCKYTKSRTLRGCVD